MRKHVPRIVWVSLFLFIAISLVYQLTGAVSLIVGYFDLRHQVGEPAIGIDAYSPTITRVAGVPAQLGIAVGDTVESINGEPYRGRAQWLATRWHAQSGDILRLGIRKSDGARSIVEIPLRGEPPALHLGESIFIIFLEIVVPLTFLLAGYWVALARPTDPNAWFILILLSYPQAYISVSTYNWWPGPWLVLRLAWHLALESAAPVALLWLSLLFPERSRIDIRVPWLKWLVLIIAASGLGVALLSDYGNWYDWTFLSERRRIDTIADAAINWLTLGSIVLYGIAIFTKLRTATTADARRRLRVLCLGSSVGLGSALVIWGILPRFGFNPANIHWLGYTSALLIVIFPFSIAYVVLVQRAMDVQILVRTGTRYILARGTVLVVQFSVIAVLLFRVLIPLAGKKHDYAVTALVAVFMFAVLFRFNFVKRSPGDRLREWIDRKFFREPYHTDLILSELADRARLISDPSVLLQTISSRISEVLHIQKMAVLLRSGNAFHLQPVMGIADEWTLSLPEDSASVQHLIRTSSPAVLYRDRPEDWLLDASGNEKEALNELHAEVLLPLAGRNKLMGVLVLGPKRSEEPYSPNDLQLLSSVGAQAGLGLEIGELARSLSEEAAKHQRVQREVEIAREVQERLFPEIPAVEGLDLAGYCRPALGVGGDYYDVIELEDGRLALAIGDISGKGIAAALLMASLRASLRGILDAGSEDLARIVTKLNRLIHESSTVNRYATFFLAIYDPAEREFRYVNAGHNPPLLLRRPVDGRNGETIQLEACGPVIGLLKDVQYEERREILSPGDLLIGFTDGISEAMTAEDEEWGEERLQVAAEAARDSSAKEIIDRLFVAADAFAAGAPQHDDMTLLVFRLVGVAKERR